MNRSKLSILADEVLSQMEIEETTLLSWGFVGGVFDVPGKVASILSNPPTPTMYELWQEIQANGQGMDAIIADLSHRKLLFCDGKWGRTRYAETVRLLYTLKQRFSFEDWQTASNLVSNIKMDLKYRNYPRRDLDWDAIEPILRTMNISGDIGILGIKTIKALLNEGSLNLAQFQLRSLQHLSKALRSYRDTSTIIGAGTGAGKTKAFYLPALTSVVNTVNEDPSAWTRVLSIYPRIELLKDQVAECISEINKMIPLLLDQGLRHISIGAYYGDTPVYAKDVSKVDGFYKWNKLKQDYECPFLKCPQCGSALVWPAADYDQELEDNLQGVFGRHEVLVCSQDCGVVLDGHIIRLTRKHMQLSPPDILFTTTEMLNRKLSDLDDQYLFGLQTNHPPRMLLLDEVHIYEGINGAHVAYLIRRWRNMVRGYCQHSVVHYVGLSATLTNPTNFFANLTGVSEKFTTYICPYEDEMTAEGMEYNLVLRGDPVSATSLLSTSVQTAMLLGRMLDPFEKSVSEGAWGVKVFGFSDKLDILNRWYHAQVDSEKNKLLSQFRDIAQVQEETKNLQKRMGQVWPIAESISPKCLRKAMDIGITSSQSRGVDPHAKVVLASSTLEVGFNDQLAGAVIQHKAPRNSASFIQRKGRAGRPRGMRPWTIVVTSAYGRDRWAYENPEQLFNPLLPELSLPIRNSYVQHIQAAFALMDWLGLNLYRRGYTSVNVWNLLSPKKSHGQYRSEKKIVIEILSQVMAGNYHDLLRFIEGSLQINQTDLDRVLWAPPRSLMFDLIPSLHAKMIADWGYEVINYKVKPVHDETIFPLQGYVPRTLFSEIELRELAIEIPGRSQPEMMGLLQGVTEFAPGNASKRFANLKYIGSAHWFSPGDTNVIEIPGERMKAKQIAQVKDSKGELSVFMPQSIKVEEVPKSISDRSTGYLEWQTVIERDLVDHSISIELDDSMKNLFSDVIVLANQNNTGLHVIRYASAVNVEKKPRKGDSERMLLQFKNGDERAAIGFASYVDAQGWFFKIPDLRQIVNSSLWPRIMKQVRPDYYMYRLKSDPYLKSILSVFEIEWLWQICLASCVAISVANGIILQEAINEYSKRIRKTSEYTLKVIFQIQPLAEQDEPEEGPRLYQRLLNYIEDQEINQRLLLHLTALHEDITIKDGFWAWLEERYLSTIAAGLVAAINALLPDVDVDEILVDIDGECIWLSEPSSGGMGTITEIMAAINSRPREFSELFLSSITECHRHELAEGLNAVTKVLDNYSLQESFKNVRKAQTLAEQKDSLIELQRVMYGLSVTPTHELVIAIMHKMTNNNSSQLTDKLLSVLHKNWHQEEERLGCLIDARTFAVASLRIGEVEKALEDVLISISKVNNIGKNQKINIVDSMLWSDCESSCPDCLQLTSRFRQYASPFKLLVMAQGYPGDQVIDYLSSEWQNRIYELLQKYGRVMIKCAGFQLEMCRSEIANFTLIPVEIGFELLYPFVAGIKNYGTDWMFDVRIREVLHA